MLLVAALQPTTGWDALYAHLGVPLPTEELAEEARQERSRLDSVVAERPDAQAYLRRLEELPSPEAMPGSGGIAAEVERFLRETTGEDRNPFEDL